MASLFGATPQEILYNQFKEDEKMRMLRNQQISQEGGQFGVFAPLYQASRKFGEMGSQAITGALFPEMTNPALAKAQKLQEILGKYQQEGTNLSDPATLTKMGGELITSGLGEEGIKAITLAKSLTPESPYAKIDPSKYTPESLKKFAVSKNVADLVSLEKQLSPTDLAKQTIFELSQKKEKTEEERSKLAAAFSVLEATRPKTIQNISLQGNKNVLDVDKKDAEKYLAVQDSSGNALSTLSRMKELYGKGVTTGTLSEARNSFLTALDSIGLSTGKARSVISNNEQFQKETEALIQQVLKIYGYNPSNVDVIRAAKSVPSLANSSEGLGKLIDSLVNIKEQEYAEATRALDYYRENEGSFKGFKKKLNIQPVSKTTGLEGLSDQQLMDMLKKRQAQGK